MEITAQQIKKMLCFVILVTAKDETEFSIAYKLATSRTNTAKSSKGGREMWGKINAPEKLNVRG